MPLSIQVTISTGNWSCRSRAQERQPRLQLGFISHRKGHRLGYLEKRETEKQSLGVTEAKRQAEDRKWCEGNKNWTVKNKKQLEGKQHRCQEGGVSLGKNQCTVFISLVKNCFRMLILIWNALPNLSSLPVYAQVSLGVCWINTFSYNTWRWHPITECGSWKKLRNNMSFSFDFKKLPFSQFFFFLKKSISVLSVYV